MTTTTASVVTDADDIMDEVMGSVFGSPTKSKPVAAVTEEVTTEVARYDFDDDFQAKIAALSLRDPQFVAVTRGLIKPDYFDSPVRAFAFMCADAYYQKYKTLFGSKAAMAEFVKEQVKEKRLPEAIKAELPGELGKLLKTPLDDAAFIADKVCEFARHQAVQNAMLGSLKHLEDRNFGSIEKLLKEALSVGLNTDMQGEDYFETIEARTLERKDRLSGKIKAEGITTGVKALDTVLYHKGWGRKELTVFMAGAKRGKSTALGYHALKACLAGYNVLYVTLEVATKIIKERMDACLSEVPMSQIISRPMDVQNAVNTKGSVPGRGVLKMNEYPSGSLTPGGLRRLIESYRSKGITFDLIAVDYADIMTPDVYTPNPIENSKQVWLGLRAIASEENAVMLSATQTNREGFKSDTAKAEHAAEDFNKVRIVDLMISINSTDEERDKGEARLYFAASRNQAGGFTINIKQDLTTMRFITGVAGAS